MASSSEGSPSGALPERGSMTEYVMDYVREQVIAGEMKPSELFSVQQLSDKVGVSRSPVRDGLLRLEEAGLVSFERNRGFRVILTSPDDVAEIFCLRMAMEGPAAARSARVLHHPTATGPNIRSRTELDAVCNVPGMSLEEFSAEAQRLRAVMERLAQEGREKEFFDADQQLHGLILRAAHLPRSERLIANLRTSTRLLGASTAISSRSFTDILTEHDPVIDAIVAGEPEQARAAMLAHLDATAELLVAQALKRAGRAEPPKEIWSRLKQDFM